MKLWVDDWDAAMGVTGTTWLGQTSPSGRLKRPARLANAPMGDVFVAHAFTDSFDAAGVGTVTARVALDTFIARVTP